MGDAKLTNQACNYTLTLWTRLSRFRDHPQLELSNNLTENSMRRVALGRRNWNQLFEGECFNPPFALDS